LTTEQDKAARRKAKRLRVALLWTASISLACVTLVVAAIAGWLLYAQHRVAADETRPRNLAAPPGGYWIHSYDTRIHFREWGARNAKPLLLVHGTGAWSGTWVSNAEAMAAAGFHVVAMDLPPFGFSDLPESGDYSRAAQARRIQAVLQRLGPQPVTVLGHSFGGGPAAEAAMLDPQRVAHLVLVDAAIGLQPENPPPCEVPRTLRTALGWPGLRTALVGATATDPRLTAWFLRKFVAREEAITPERAAIYQKPFVNENFSAGLADWARQFATGCVHPASAQPKSWRQLQLPVSLVWGEQDSVTPLLQAQALAALLPRARLTVLPGVGHIPQIENVPQVNRVIAEVLRSPP
jgi:pimeloyl-ACP methyl ester carboxylesterase